MSALRKIRQLREKEELEKKRLEIEEEQGGEQEEEEEAEARPVVHASAFALLNDEDEEEANEVSEGEEEEVPVATQSKKKKNSKAKQKPKQSLAEDHSGSQSKSAKNKKKKQQQQHQKSLAHPTKPSSHGDLDDLDAVLAEFHIPTSSTSQHHQQQQAEQKYQILSTDAKFLNADNEIKRRFGNVREAKDSSSSAAPLRARNVRGSARSSARAGAGAASGSAVRGMFVQPKRDWPPLDVKGMIKLVSCLPPSNPSLTSSASFSTSASSNTSPSASVPLSERKGYSMVEEEAPASSPSASSPSASNSASLASLVREKWFQLDHSPEYDRLQQEYLSVVNSYDPEAIAWFVRHHPYHADALLQMSHLYETQSEYTHAANLVQRCLYVLQSALTADFTVMQGNCRMAFDSHNRTLFNALSRHAQILGKQGCPRTALELCKLLLSLSPSEDPLALTYHALDYYAIRSAEYAWLLQFVHESRAFEPLLPPRMQLNLAFSSALAKFHLEEEQKASSSSSSSSSASASASSSDILSSEMVDIDPSPCSASDLLQQAMCLFPEVLRPLLKKVNEHEANKRVWVDALRVLEGLHSSSISSAASEAVSRAFIERLATIYVERMYSLWSGDAVLSWLAQQAQLVSQKLLDGRAKRAEFSAIRLSVYARPLPAAVRALQLSDYSDHVPTVPEELRRPMMQQQPLPGGNGNGMLGPGQRALDLNQHPLAVFLQSMLPWMGLGPDGEGAGQLEDNGFHEDDFVDDAAFDD